MAYTFIMEHESKFSTQRYSEHAIKAMRSRGSTKSHDSIAWPLNRLRHPRDTCIANYVHIMNEPPKKGIPTPRVVSRRVSSVKEAPLIALKLVSSDLAAPTCRQPTSFNHRASVTVELVYT